MQFLLLQYGSGHWDLVKGHALRGEREEEAVMRELAEETGIRSAWFIPGYREVINYFFRAKRRTVFKEVVYYLVETEEKAVMISFEHIGYRWLPFEEALAQATFQNTRDVLAKACRFLALQKTAGLPGRCER
jgi:8-oxo-dGTP pyrophosphatase MutT (NUDIX family)